MTSLAKRAVEGASATLMWQIVRLILLVGSIVVLARLLGPADFGLIAMVTAVIGVGELVRDFGLSVATLQAKTLTQYEKTNLFWLNSLVGVLLGIVVYLGSWPLSLLYGDERIVAITQCLSFAVVLNGFATQFKAQINRELRFIVLGVTEAIPQVVGLSAAIIIAAKSGSYWALVAQPLIVAALGFALCVFLSRWRPGLYRREVPIRRFVRFAGALVGTQLLAYISKNIDTVLLGAARGPQELGLYNRAYQIVVLPLAQITTPLSRVAIPILSRIQGDTRLFIQYIYAAQFLTISTLSVFYGVIVGFGDPLVRLILGDQWMDSVPILQILAVSGVFRALGQVPYWIFVTLGQTGKQLTIYSFGQPVIVAAIVVGVSWGAIGVAVGCAVGYGVFWLLNMWWAGRATQLPVGHLTLSGLLLVALFGLPSGAAGAVAVYVFGSSVISLSLGVLSALVWILAVAFGVPRYRAQIVRIIRLVRHP